jgi:hypothetical protein
MENLIIISEQTKLALAGLVLGAYFVVPNYLSDTRKKKKGLVFSSHNYHGMG